jgi:DNA-binding CsgD family transcriptional regulator
VLPAPPKSSLTPSERRIAQLAASGLSNRDIAQNLFITARTVEGHLTHAYHKFAITSREQLPPRSARNRTDDIARERMICTLGCITPARAINARNR